jgi:SHS family sialic acid transporter-like MFS transporter
MHSPSPRQPTRRQLFLTILAAFLGWMFDGMEMGIFPIVARPALKEMAPHLAGTELDTFVGFWMGWATALFLWGAAVGGVIFGWLGDRIGRVRAMSASILCYSLFTGLSYFAMEPWHLPAFRFIAALGMGGEWALGVALVMEVWPSDKRPLMAALIGAAANVGFALIASVEIFFPVMRDNWRFILLLGATPAFLTFFIRIFVPESEKWQEAASKGPGQPLREIFRPPLLKNTLIAMVLASVALIATWGAVQWMALWAPQVAGPSVPNAKNYTQVLSALGAVLGGFVGAYMGSRLGRRWSFFLLCVASLALCSYLFRSPQQFDLRFMVLVFFVGCFTAAFYGWMPLYFPELFPTRVRATAQGLAFNSGRILAGVGALQMSSLIKEFNGSYAQAGATIVLVYAVGMIAIWFAPETRGRPLPD